MFSFDHRSNETAYSKRRTIVQVAEGVVVKTINTITVNLSPSPNNSIMAINRTCSSPEVMQPIRTQRTAAMRTMLLSGILACKPIKASKIPKLKVPQARERA